VSLLIYLFLGGKALNEPLGSCSPRPAPDPLRGCPLKELEGGPVRVLEELRRIGEDAEGSLGRHGSKKRALIRAERVFENFLEKGVLAMTIAASALVAAGAQARAAQASDIP